MRLVLILALAASLPGSVGAIPASAQDVYKGTGSRIRDYSWIWRASGSVGFHGVEDPWDQFGVSSFPIGGYTNLGFELKLPGQNSFEILGGYFWVRDSQNVVRLEGPPEVPQPGTYSYEVESFTAAGMWRVWTTTGSSATYLGLGGGWVFGSRLRYEESISGSERFEVEARGSGPQVHLVFGYEGVPAHSLRMGVELGYRYSWVDFDNGISGAGNFNGIHLGFRFGYARPAPRN